MNARPCCQICGRPLPPGDPGDAGTEYHLDYCCTRCARALEQGLVSVYYRHRQETDPYGNTRYTIKAE
jgi:hypothetical protein